MGRKGRYEEFVKPYLSEIEKKVKEGVTEEAIAKALGVSKSAFNTYKTQHPELVEALKPKGAEVLEKLVNAGIESACGYYRENETTTIVIDEDGKASKKQKTITKTWFPPNASLNIFYVKNYGKDKGFMSDPLEYELKKARQELDEKLAKDKNWLGFLGGMGSDSDGKKKDDDGEDKDDGENGN